MIHIEQNQKIPENPGLRVLSPTGDYNDVDLIECAPLDGDDIAVASLQAQFIKYGGLVYRYNEPEELGKAIYEVDKASTHDSALLFAEDEARRLKRKAGTLVPENQVQADEAVSATQKAKAAVLDEESQPTPDGVDEGTLVDTKKDTATTTPATTKSPVTTATTTPTTTIPGTTATSTPPIGTSTTPFIDTGTSTTTAPFIDTTTSTSTPPIIDIGNSTTTPGLDTGTTTSTTTPGFDTGSSTTTQPIIDIGSSTPATAILDTNTSTTTPQNPILNTDISSTTPQIIEDTVQAIGTTNPIVAFAKKQIGRKLGL